MTDLNHIKVVKNKEIVDIKKEGEVTTKLLAQNQVQDEKIQFLEYEVKSFREKVTVERQVNQFMYI